MTAPDRPAPAGSRPSGRDALRRIVIALAVLAALALLLLAAFMADTDSAGREVSVRGDAVESVTPARDAEVLQQQPIQIDLATGWTGDLAVNGIAIPEDQLLRNEGSSIIGFQPGAGKIVESLEPGPNCAQATIWRVVEGPEGASAQVVEWCFEAT